MILFCKGEIMKNEIICKIGIGNHKITNNDMNANGFPLNSQNNNELRICCDVRKEECPYSVKLNLNTEYISLEHCLCAYSIRKK